MMRVLLTFAVLVASAGVSGCGGGDQKPAAAGPITLTDEQAKAIAAEDGRVQEEEGGAFLAEQAKKAKKRQR